jgi:hypothetical protein
VASVQMMILDVQEKVVEKYLTERMTLWLK